jgi:hypothetical protein
MEIKFVLDFDGVLFNSAFEAFSVANHATKGRAGFRQDVNYEEFLAFRSVVTDAWQYNRLYAANSSVLPNTLHMITPDEGDWSFSRDFFEARRVIMEDPEWPKVMPAYDFFFLLKPLLLQCPDRFAILSTRNVSSIHEALAFNGVDGIQIFGQEDIRKLGSKLSVAKSQNWLDPKKYLVVYVDDMNSHLEPFQGQVHLPLHANWGYDRETSSSLNQSQIHIIISSLLSIADGTRT